MNLIKDLQQPYNIVVNRSPRAHGDEAYSITKYYGPRGVMWSMIILIDEPNQLVQYYYTEGGRRGMFSPELSDAKFKELITLLRKKAEEQEDSIDRIRSSVENDVYSKMNKIDDEASL